MSHKSKKTYPAKSSQVSRECLVKSEELHQIADRCFLKSCLLGLLRVEHEVESESEIMKSENSSQHAVHKQVLCEKAGIDGVFLWMLLPEFRIRTSESTLQHLQKGMFTLSFAAYIVNRIWAAPSPSKSFQRQAAILLFQTQALVERALEAVGFDGDHDQVMVYWWVKSISDGLGVRLNDQEDSIYSDELKFEMLLESLSRLKGAANLSEESEESENDDEELDELTAI